MENVRIVAAYAISRVVQNGESLSSIMADHLDMVDDNDRSLLQQMVYGCLRHYIAIDGYLAGQLKKPIRNKEQVVKSLLMLGVYQLVYMRTPAFAAINETVACAEQLDKTWASGLLNAVLRNTDRDQPDLSTFDNLPTWLLKRLKNAWPKQLDEIKAASDVPAPMMLRYAGNDDAQSVINQLAENEIDGVKLSFAQHGYQLENPCDVGQVPEFFEGLFSVQDEAAQLSAPLLDLEDGMSVLDACSAPGGKSLHILQSADVELTCLDLEENRLARVQENLERANKTANLVCTDALDVDNWWNGQLFDRILLDAPCSATGVIRRHPDIKLLRKDDDIYPLVQLQQSMLEKLWLLLAPGGIMVYATCSVLPDENAKQVQRFLKKTDDAQEIELDVDWGIKQKIGRQLLPQINGHDGFYYAKLKKNKTL